MTNHIAEEKLKHLEEIIEVIREFERIPKTEFVRQKRTYFGAIYALVTGIEIICDLGSHLLSYFFNRRPETYRQTIIQLAELEIIPEKLAKESQDMVGFRNLAVHVYGKIDPKKVYQYLKLAEQQFLDYLKHFIRFFQKRSNDSKVA